MAIKPDKVNFNNIDEVKNGDGITPEHINYPLKASALAQAIATNSIDTTEIANTKKTPSLEIINPTTNPQLKAINLKGATGAKIVKTEEVGVDSNGGIVYKQTFDDGSTATFTSPQATKLYITNVVDDTSTYYSIRTVKTDDGGEPNTITFVLG